jgi:hypothetical protein
MVYHAIAKKSLMIGHFDARALHRARRCGNNLDYVKRKLGKREAAQNGG